MYLEILTRLGLEGGINFTVMLNLEDGGSNYTTYSAISMCYLMSSMGFTPVRNSSVLKPLQC